MLLRLLPAPSARQSAPPTILFTLPLAVAPYTSKSLPLPPFLLAHRNACAKEGVDCSNALLGDKSSWFSGIVDEVTFNAKEKRIIVVLIDGTSMVLPITQDCRSVLDAVVAQVQLSFTAQQQASAGSGPSKGSRSGSSSSTGTSSSSSGLRSPSALLSALLSPIMNNVSSSASKPAPPPPNPARTHRRQARSLLVDAFRRYVLTALKDALPSSFMMWSLQRELSVKRQEWEEIKREVNGILGQTGQRPVVMYRSPSDASTCSSGSHGGRVRRSGSSESINSYASSSTSDSDSSLPLTPATSVWSHEVSSPGISPLAHLSTLPACATLPFHQRTTYADLVSRLAGLASRLTSIQKLINMIEKEQGRRKWLESLEASRQVDKAMRRSWSNRASLKGCSGSESMARPTRSSALWQSHVQEDDRDVEHDSVLHAIMMDIDEDMSSSSEEEGAMSDDDVFSPHIKVRPISPIDVSSLFSSMPAVPALVPSSPTGSSEEELDPIPAMLARRRSSAGLPGNNTSSDQSMDRMQNRRPSLETMDLSKYRIVSTASIDADERDGGSLLGHMASGEVHEILPKAGETGFRVGVAIVR